MNENKSGKQLQILHYQNYRKQEVEGQVGKVRKAEYDRHYYNPGINAVEQHCDKYPATRANCIVG